ncbi:MAG: signal peptidase I [Alphaproteobacteria bacterium]|nr:signal peptidase I [Alphaproteobacteria bacterium]
MSESQKKSGGFRETVKTVLYAVAIALVVRTVAIEPFNIPSGSMIPTLLVGDYLFVSKYSYGYSRHSLPFSPPVISDRILYTPPERGDVAVFKWPRDDSTDYIKRIVGLPGDRIQVRAGVLHINGTPVKLEKVGTRQRKVGGWVALEVTEYVETLPNGRQHVIYQQTTSGPHNNTAEVVIPPAHFFAMGDNRDSSQDSRAWGFVPAENLVGRAEFLFFSTDGSARIWEIWKWPQAIRFGRLFNGIE